MPFPLAHPAAILPLRRYCPRFFNFAALVMGSLMPDAGYFFGPLHLHIFSHGFLGSVLFCLPLGLAFYELLYGLRSLALRKGYPSKFLDLLKLAWPARGTALVATGSILVGTWTHDLLDSFTHETGWVAQTLPLLQGCVGSFAGRSIKVYGILWFICSFIGVALLVVAFQNWRPSFSRTPIANSPAASWRSALLVASAVLPIELVHRLLNNLLGIVLVCLLTFLLVVVVVRRLSPGETTMAR